MNDRRFGELSKAAYAATSRRQALKIAGAAAAGGMMSLVSPDRAGAVGRCKKGGYKCRENSECCSNFCNPATASCECGPGTNTCPATGICVTCGPSQVFNPSTCACECPTGTTTCANACCPPGQVCAAGQCCINPLSCTADGDCCTGYQCSGAAKGIGTCQPCINPAHCKLTAECCSGFVCAPAPGGNVCTPMLTP
jgi:hypothetical protein